MERRQTRSTKMSEDQLESNVDTIYETVHDLMNQSDQCDDLSVEKVRILQQDLRKCYRSYKLKVQELCTVKARNGRIKERSDLLLSAEEMKTTYYEKILYLSEIRKQGNDDNISEVTCPSDYNELSIGDKCNDFIQNQPLNATEPFSTPSNEVESDYLLQQAIPESNSQSHQILNPSSSSSQEKSLYQSSNVITSLSNLSLSNEISQLIAQSQTTLDPLGRTKASILSSTPKITSTKYFIPSTPSVKPNVQFYQPDTDSLLNNAPNTNYSNFGSDSHVRQSPLENTHTRQSNQSYRTNIDSYPPPGSANSYPYNHPIRENFYPHNETNINPSHQMYGQLPNMTPYAAPTFPPMINQNFTPSHTFNYPSLEYQPPTDGRRSDNPSASANFQPQQEDTPTNRFTSHLRPVLYSLHNNPLLPVNNPPPPGVIQNGTARLLIKTQLCNGQDKTNVYRGEPSKFVGFIEKLRSKISNLQLDYFEIIEVVTANSEDKAKNAVSLFEFNAFRHGEDALNELWKELYSTFGHPRHISNEINQRLLKLGHIKSSEEVDKLKELLQVCNLISVNMHGETDYLMIYDSEHGQSQIFHLLPPDLFNKWRRIVAPYEGRSPKFERLVSFIKGVIKEVTALTKNISPFSRLDNVPKKPFARSFYVSSSDDRNVESSSKFYENYEKYCAKHDSLNHDLFDCKLFLADSIDSRVEFIKSRRLCFRCYKPHKFGSCNYTPKCDKCSGRHQTSMHDSEYIQSMIKNINSYSASNMNPRPNNIPSATAKDEASSLCLWGSSVNQVEHSYSKVVLVNVSSSKSGKSVKCYAILDEQSSRSFISPALAELLDVGGTHIDYSLNTMNGLKSFTSGKLIDGLRIRGNNQMKTYSLPPLVTNEFIPNCLDEVATPEAVASHPHVKRFSKFFLPLNNSVSVLILIGRDSEDLMKTSCLNNKAPFVHKTSLGYALVGSTTGQSVFKNNFNVLRTAEHFQMSQMVPPTNKEFLCHHNITANIGRLPDDLLLGLSQDNIKFDHIMLSGTHVNVTDNV